MDIHHCFHFDADSTTTLVHLPPLLQPCWSTARRFPVGSGFVCQFFAGRIWLWGGEQNQGPSSRMLALPTNIAYTFRVDFHQLANGKKRRITVVSQPLLMLLQSQRRFPSLSLISDLDLTMRADFTFEQGCK